MLFIAFADMAVTELIDGSDGGQAKQVAMVLRITRRNVVPE